MMLVRGREAPPRKEDIVYEKVYGPKYEASKNLAGGVEIAKLVRADIKAAVKAGTLPKGKYSVKSDFKSIDVKVSDLNITVYSEAALTSPGRVYVYELYSERMAAALKTLREIHGAYNYDGSDLASDYFNVRYYGDVSLDWKWAEEKLASEKLARAASPVSLTVAKLTDEEVFELAVASAAKHGIVPIPAPKLYLVPSPAPSPSHLDFLAFVGAL
jgi:hypothetical protein